MSAFLEWAIFLGLSTVSVAMAALMLVTMSMYRAGLALMSSFVALGGLFILLDADLMALIQLMMNVGGMMVMILFMVMMMMDPGGEMMWDMKRKMKLRGPGALSMAMPRGPPPEDAEEETAVAHGNAQITGGDWTCPMHPEVSLPGPGTCPKCGMDLVPRAEGGTQGISDGMPAMSPRAHYRMMVDMAMSTAQLPWALAIGAASAVLLALLMVRIPWGLSSALPSQDSTAKVGELLLSSYMVAFEGAAFLILAGMVGAVVFAGRETAPSGTCDSPPPVPAVPGVVYTCPMHPEVRQPAPGQCPKCGMNLVPENAGAAAHAPSGSHR